MDGVEPELEQAAYLDGCSHWGAFLRIILPQARPGIMALAILCWLVTWNEFLFALILTGSRPPHGFRRASLRETGVAVT